MAVYIMPRFVLHNLLHVPLQCKQAKTTVERELAPGVGQLSAAHCSLLTATCHLPARCTLKILQQFEKTHNHFANNLLQISLLVAPPKCARQLVKGRLALAAVTRYVYALQPWQYACPRSALPAYEMLLFQAETQGAAAVMTEMGGCFNTSCFVRLLFNWCAAIGAGGTVVAGQSTAQGAEPACEGGRLDVVRCHLPRRARRPVLQDPPQVRTARQPFACLLSISLALLLPVNRFGF